MGWHRCFDGVRGPSSLRHSSPRVGHRSPGVRKCHHSNHSILSVRIWRHLGGCVDWRERQIAKLLQNGNLLTPEQRQKVLDAINDKYDECIERNRRPGPSCGYFCVRGSLAGDYFMCIGWGLGTESVRYVYIFNVDCIAFTYISCDEWDLYVVDDPPGTIY